VLFEQINRCRRGMLGQDARMARVARVGRGMSLVDTTLLAGKFERIPEQGDAKNTEKSGKWTVDS